jgi:hypothetical protein
MTNGWIIDIGHIFLGHGDAEGMTEETHSLLIRDKDTHTKEHNELSAGTKQAYSIEECIVFLV